MQLRWKLTPQVRDLEIAKVKQNQTQKRQQIRQSRREIVIVEGEVEEGVVEVDLEEEEQKLNQNKN